MGAFPCLSSAVETPTAADTSRIEAEGWNMEDMGAWANWAWGGRIGGANLRCIQTPFLGLIYLRKSTQTFTSNITSAGLSCSIAAHGVNSKEISGSQISGYCGSHDGSTASLQRDLHSIRLLIISIIHYVVPKLWNSF